MTLGAYKQHFPDEFAPAIRTAVIFISLVGIVLGIIVLVWPRATLLVVAVLFGLALIAAGLLRLFTAVVATMLPGRWRLLLGVLSVAIIAAGVLVLANPTAATWLLAVFIGAGWLVQGIAELIGVVTGSGDVPRGLAVASGVISVIAGLVLLILPVTALQTLVWVAGILLIVVSVANLFTLPAALGR